MYIQYTYFLYQLLLLLTGNWNNLISCSSFTFNSYSFFCLQKNYKFQHKVKVPFQGTSSLHNLFKQMKGTKYINSNENYCTNVINSVQFSSVMVYCRKRHDWQPAAEIFMFTTTKITKIDKHYNFRL